MYELRKKVPEWLELIPASGKLPAVEGLFKPVSRSMKRVASAAVRAALGETEMATIAPEVAVEAGDEFTKSLVRQGLIDWRGIADEKGKRLAFTPEAIELFLSDETLFDAADQVYVVPVVRRDREKNASSASPNGTGGAETPAKAIAVSSAKRSGKGGAKPASTGSTSRKATTERTPGNC